VTRTGGASSKTATRDGPPRLAVALRVPEPRDLGYVLKVRAIVAAADAAAHAQIAAGEGR
jgi:hypothetical protein